MDRTPAPPYSGPPVTFPSPSPVQPTHPAHHQPGHHTYHRTAENVTSRHPIQTPGPSGFTMETPAPPYPGPPLHFQSPSPVQPTASTHQQGHHMYETIVEPPANSTLSSQHQKHSPLAFEKTPAPPYPGPPLDTPPIHPSITAHQPGYTHQQVHYPQHPTAQSHNSCEKKITENATHTTQTAKHSGFTMETPAPPYPGPPLHFQSPSPVQPTASTHQPGHGFYETIVEPPANSTLSSQNQKHSPLAFEKTPAPPYPGPPLDTPPIHPSITAHQPGYTHQQVHYPQHPTAQSHGSYEKRDTEVITQTTEITKLSLETAPSAGHSRPPLQYQSSIENSVAGASSSMYSTYYSVAQPAATVPQAQTVIQHRTQNAIIHHPATPTVIQTPNQVVMQARASHTIIQNPPVMMQPQVLPTVIQPGIQSAVTMVQPQVLPTVIQPGLQQTVRVVQPQVMTTVMQPTVQPGLTMYQAQTPNTVVYRI